MALIFQRLARNFIKNGYFPTDEETITRIVNMIDAPPNASIQLFDPCCGEGIALAECGHHLKESGCDVTTAAIEFNQERALHAKTLLHHVVHADIQDCVVGQQQFGMLWLNPPYGDRLTDQSDQASSSKGRDRLEKYFLSATLPSLQYGGLLVYIVPHYVLDKHLARQLAISLDKASVYRLTEERFRQVVVLGYRRRQVPAGKPEKAFIEKLLAIREDRLVADELPVTVKTLNKIVKRDGKLQRETLNAHRYTLPAATRTRPVILAPGINAGGRAGFRACAFTGWSQVVGERWYTQAEGSDNGVSGNRRWDGRNPHPG